MLMILIPIKTDRINVLQRKEGIILRLTQSSELCSSKETKTKTGLENHRVEARSTGPAFAYSPFPLPRTMPMKDSFIQHESPGIRQLSRQLTVKIPYIAFKWTEGNSTRRSFVNKQINHEQLFAYMLAMELLSSSVLDIIKGFDNVILTL